MAVTLSVPVDEIVDVIVSTLRARGYQESTIRVVGSGLKALKAWCDQHGGDYTSVLGAQFAQQTTSAKTGRFSPERRCMFGRITRLADSYLRSGEIDLSTKKKTRSSAVVEPVVASFRLLLDSWDGEMASRGLSAETCYLSRQIVCRFFVFAEEQGRMVVEQISGADVTGFLTKLAGSTTRDGLRTWVGVLRPFIKFTGRPDLIAAISMVRFERPRAIMPVLTGPETTAVFQVLATGRVSARDRAIVLLAMTTGLRACDIAGLTLDDLDWHGGRICLTQSKTGNPLVLPLLPTIGNALAEYLLSGRPATTDRHVFIRTKAPHIRFADHAGVYAVMEKVFAAAGVQPGRCGTRLVRHSAATRLLVAGTPLPTISAVLGHARPQSADRYLATDAARLRDCVLSLPELLS